MQNKAKFSKLFIAVVVILLNTISILTISTLSTPCPFENDAVQASKIEDIYLAPLGLTVGIKVDTEGVVVIGTSTVVDSSGHTHTPSHGILHQGDTILFANNIKLENKEHLIGIIEDNESVTLDLKRHGDFIKFEIETVKDHKDINRLGIWIRDVAQGIGTVTYYNPSSGKFGALGHGIMDVETNDLMQIRGGKVSLSNIEDVKKGKKGDPGELIGVSNGDIIGDIRKNTSHGIYGYLDSDKLPVTGLMGIAQPSEIREDRAFILSSVEGEIKAYDVYIESVNRNSTDNSKGLVVKITDEELIDKTNGIVQGMSGSPIIQGDKIIGAVTHVFVQDPTKGYGIFIENMLKQESNM